MVENQLQSGNNSAFARGKANVLYFFPGTVYHKEHFNQMGARNLAPDRYRYDPPIWGDVPPPQRGNQQNNNGDDISWLAIAILLAVFWPVGLYLLFCKLMGTPTGRAAGSSGVGASPRAAARRPTAAAGTTGATPRQPPAPPRRAKTAKTAQASRATSPTVHKAVKPSAGRGFTIAGAVITWIFGMGLAAMLPGALAGSAAFLDALPGLVTLGGFVGLGVVLLYVGIFRRRQARRFLQYLSLIGRRERVNLTSLSKAAGRSRKKVCAELQDMLDLGVLPQGYLDLAGDQLVLSAQGLEDKPEPEPQRQAADASDDILRQIREVNDAIPDPVMSAKIDRIGELTGKILDYQRKNPDKSGQLRSFLNYYLPTTLRLLNSYAQLDRQGVEGENISAAKQRIEGMMDKVVEGFETQLDRLFQGEAMDITTDVSVLEQMLNQDGLGHNTTPFGGT